MSVAGLYEMLRSNLVDAGIWGSRVFADAAPAGVERPYCVYFVVSGGADNVRAGLRDASYVVTVKCVADDLGTSLQGAGQINAVLHDRGGGDRIQDLIQPDGWYVMTVTADRVVHLVERFEGAVPIYHDGQQFLVVMEAKYGY